LLLRLQTILAQATQRFADDLCYTNTVLESDATGGHGFDDLRGQGMIN